MRRTFKFLLTLATLCLILLSASVMGFWWRSYTTTDVVAHFTPGGWYCRIISEKGGIRWQAAPGCPFTGGGTTWYIADAPAPTGSFLIPANPLVGNDGAAWYQAEVSDPGFPMHVRDLGGPAHLTTDTRISYWVISLVALLTTLLPAQRLASRLRRNLTRRRQVKVIRANRCPQCHYDLRATPTRCPECGHEPELLWHG